MAGRCNSGAPRSVKRRSLTVLPDAEVADFGLESEDHAFAEQVGTMRTAHYQLVNLCQPVNHVYYKTLWRITVPSQAAQA